MPRPRLFIAAAFINVYLWNSPLPQYHYYSRGSRIEVNSANGARSKLFVISDTKLDQLKHISPSAVRTNNAHNPKNNFTVDVVSIGSNTRLHFLHAQLQTWSSHVHVRNFWGFTELQDYDANCTSAMDAAIDEHLKICRSSCTSPTGTISPCFQDSDIYYFATHRYAQTEYGMRSQGGWVCAQRRVGRALGWVHAQYNQNGDDELPDVLVFVDDDTALDISNLKGQILKGSKGDEQPLVYAGCSYPKTTNLDLATKGWPYSTPHGGFGTFFTKEAVRKLVQPIICNKYQTPQICMELLKNRIGERSVFDDGISILELFYRYSALRNYCMHSDWTMGYMINYYLYPTPQDMLPLANPPLCGNVTDSGAFVQCTGEYTACHRQGPEDMESLAIRKFTERPGDYYKVPALAGTKSIFDSVVPKAYLNERQM